MTQQSKKIIIYSRVSTKHQAVDGHSITQQIDLCQQKAASLSLVVDEVIMDEGFSATSLVRPGIKRIIKMVRQNSIKALIVTSLDRLSRDIVDTAKLFDELDKHNVKLYGVNFDASRSTADERLVMNLLSVISQSESEKTSERTINGLSGSLKDGFFPFRPPFGYSKEAVSISVLEVNGKLKRKKKYNLVPIDSELKLVHDIYNMYAVYCMSTRAISKALKQFDSRLTESKIGIILRDPRYTGVFEYQNNVYTDLFRSTIDKILFVQVQSVMDMKKIKLSTTYIYKAKLACSCCNKTLSCTHAQSRGKKYKYYLCNNNSCKSYKTQISEAKVTSLLLPQISKLIEKDINQSMMKSKLLNSKLDEIKTVSVNSLDEEALRKFLVSKLEKQYVNLATKTVQPLLMNKMEE